MALGKNLKKQQLIKQDTKKKATSKKKVQKKSLIKEKPAKKTQPATSSLVNYISEKQLEYKKQIRKRQKEEIESLADKNVQFVVFKVGTEEFALEINRVKEVVVMPELSAAPKTPKHIKGIASIRGITFMAMDLNIKFGKKSSKEPKFLLTIEGGDSASALMLAELPATLKTEGKNVSADIKMLDSTIKDVTYIKGIIQLDERIIFFLDADELISSDKAMVVPDELVS